MSNVVDFLTGNLILNLSILAWAIAQVLKFVITLIPQGKLPGPHPRRSGFSFWYFFFCEVVI